MCFSWSEFLFGYFCSNKVQNRIKSWQLWLRNVSFLMILMWRCLSNCQQGMIKGILWTTKEMNSTRSWEDTKTGQVDVDDDITRDDDEKNKEKKKKNWKREQVLILIFRDERGRDGRNSLKWIECYLLKFFQLFFLFILHQEKIIVENIKLIPSESSLLENLKMNWISSEFE